MKHTAIKRILAVMLCMVLIAALALTFTACAGKKASISGPVHYTVIAVDLEGKETQFDITSEKAIVGEELLERGIVEGKMGSYGLFVQTVNGITLDYDKDGQYWGFYINGEYAITGLDQTNAEEGAVYTLKPEK